MTDYETEARDLFRVWNICAFGNEGEWDALSTTFRAAWLHLGERAIKTKERARDDERTRCRIALWESSAVRDSDSAIDVIDTLRALSPAAPSPAPAAGTCDACHGKGEILAPCPPDCADGDKDYPCDMGHKRNCPSPSCRADRRTP